MEPIEALYGQLNCPEADRPTAITKEEGEFIFHLLESCGITRTLEVGFAYGFSAAYILSATRSPHYVIDPHQRSQYQNIGVHNLRTIGVDGLLRQEEDYAHTALPRLHDAGLQLDFAFIDGDHKFDTTLVDFYYVDLMLQQDGYVLFHDAWMPSIQHILSWIGTNLKHYRRVDTGIANLLLVQKTGEDQRSWDHFAEFCTTKPWWRRFGASCVSRS